MPTERSKPSTRNTKPSTSDRGRGNAGGATGRIATKAPLESSRTSRKEPDPPAPRGARDRGQSIPDRQPTKRETVSRERGKSETRSKPADARAKELQERQEKEVAKLKERQEKLEKEQLRQKELERRKKEAKLKEKQKPPTSGTRSSNKHVEEVQLTLAPQTHMMSPTPQRKRWDKDRINTDLAHEDTDDDLNPKPDKIEVVKMKEHTKQIQEIQVESEIPDDGYEDYKSDFEDYSDSFEEPEEEDGPEEESDSDDVGPLAEEKAHVTEYEMEISNNYRNAMRKKELDDVKLAMQRENSVRFDKRKNGRSSGKTTLEDEAKLIQTQPGRGFINFNAAMVRQSNQTAAGRTRRRGDELLSMIRLDIVTFELFELQPIKYEDFMRTFGRSNMVEENIQTGEDNPSRDIQTDKVQLLTKWTQRPPAATLASAVEDYDKFMENVRGSGGQISREAYQAKLEKSWTFAERTDSQRLVKFLTSAGNVLLTLLEESSISEEKSVSQDKEVVFSEKVVYLSFGDYPGLIGGAIIGLHFAPDQEGILLTVHAPDDSGEGEVSEIRSYMCVWNVKLPQQPLKILVAGQKISVATFSPTKASLVLAGMVDGSIFVWDLREPVYMHREVQAIPGGADWLIRSPTYITNEFIHTSQITAIKPLPVSDTELANLDELVTNTPATTGTFPIFQVVTIEEFGGKLVIWTALDSQHDVDIHLGLAHWGSVRIVNTTVIDLNKLVGSTDINSVVAHDVTFDLNDSTHLFVATATGSVIHASAQPDFKPTPRQYKPELDSASACHSIDFCPFGEAYFLAASDDGTVRLHSITNERPLITWPGSVNGVPVSKLIWSPSRPCVFILLDTGNRIHLWDLGAGDIYPVHGVEFDDKVHAIALSPELSNEKSSQLLAIGLDAGKVEIHQLKPDYKSKGYKECKSELEKFLHYVSII